MKTSRVLFFHAGHPWCSSARHWSSRWTGPKVRPDGHGGNLSGCPGPRPIGRSLPAAPGDSAGRGMFLEGSRRRKALSHFQKAEVLRRCESHADASVDLFFFRCCSWSEPSCGHCRHTRTVLFSCSTCSSALVLGPNTITTIGLVFFQSYRLQAR